ncbi:ABC transport system periplasmic substrate binding protein [Chitinispirillum alkaliphilum]|nr:ABC transport system periplasmic substrate binding protein [Chitinispirillum alkaliphilum]
MSLSVSQKARLGVFVVAGTVLMVLFFAIPLGLRITNSFNFYNAYFTGESLSGLEQGAVVKFNGIPIGNVERITYHPHDLERVKVRLRVDSDFPMKVDMFATTGTLGITGLKYIEISGGTNEADLLKTDSEIPTRISMMASMTGRAETITEKIDLLLTHLNYLTDPDSLGGIKNIVDNVAMMSSDAREFFSEVVPSISRSSEEVISNVSEIAENIKFFTETFNEQFADDHIATILTRIDSSAVSMKELTDQVSLMILQTREDFSVSMENLRETTENANQLTRMLSENPSLLLRGEGREREIR